MGMRFVLSFGGNGDLYRHRKGKLKGGRGGGEGGMKTADGRNNERLLIRI